MEHRWSGLYGFHWAPILTFDRRREAAFEWLEGNSQVVSMLRRPTEFGVAIRRRSRRIVVHPGGIDLLLGTEDADLQDLASAARGVLEAMEPRNLHAASARIVWSLDLDMDYDAVRAANAADLTGPIPGARAYDFSALADLRTPGARLQAEFGVVDAEELRQRLTKFDNGRLKAAEMPPVERLPEELPSTSVFADVLWITSGHDVYSGGADVDSMWQYMESRVQLADQESLAAASSIANTIKRKGASDELSRGA